MTLSSSCASVGRGMCSETVSGPRSILLSSKIVGIAERIDRDLGLTIVVWHGPVTPQETVDHLVRLGGNRYWPAGERSLTDMRTATRISLPDPELVDILIEDTDLRYVRNKVVLLTPRLFAHARIPDAAADLGMDATPFTDLDVACDYLDVDRTRVARIIDDLRAEIEAASFALAREPQD